MTLRIIKKIIEDKIKLKEGEIKALTDNTFSENEKLMNSQKNKTKSFRQ